MEALFLGNVRPTFNYYASKQATRSWMIHFIRFEDYISDRDKVVTLRQQHFFTTQQVNRNEENMRSVQLQPIYTGWHASKGEFFFQIPQLLNLLCLLDTDMKIYPMFYLSTALQIRDFKRLQIDRSRLDKSDKIMFI